jgi:hypothetical protein
MLPDLYLLDGHDKLNEAGQLTDDSDCSDSECAVLPETVLEARRKQGGPVVIEIEDSDGERPGKAQKK